MLIGLNVQKWPVLVVQKNNINIISVSLTQLGILLSVCLCVSAGSEHSVCVSFGGSSSSHHSFLTTSRQPAGVGCLLDLSLLNGVAPDNPTYKIYTMMYCIYVCDFVSANSSCQDRRNQLVQVFGYNTVFGLLSWLPLLVLNKKLCGISKSSNKLND